MSDYSGWKWGRLGYKIWRFFHVRTARIATKPNNSFLHGAGSRAAVLEEQVGDYLMRRKT